MDIDYDAGTCVFVAERDNTVAIVIGLVLLDEENKCLRIRPTGESRLAPDA